MLWLLNVKRLKSKGLEPHPNFGLIPYVQVKSLMIDLYPFCSKFKLF